MGAIAYRQVENRSLHDLVKAAEAGDATLVKELLAAGAAVNEATADGMTPLMFAAACGKIEILSLLLARGADINVARKDGVTALALAAFFGHHQIVRELVARGADPATIGRFRVALEEWARARGWASVTPEPIMNDRRNVGQGFPEQNVDLTDSIKTTGATKGELPISSAAVEEIDWLSNSDPIDLSPVISGTPAYEDQQPIRGRADRIAVPEEVNLAAETKPLSRARAIAPARESSSAPVVLQQKAIARPRLLDPSVVLPHEVSYATVALHQEMADSSYSTKTELLSWRRLGVPLIGVAVSAAAIVLFLKFSTVRGIYQSLLSENTNTATPVTHTKSSAARMPVVAASNSAKPLVAPVSQQGANDLAPVNAASTFNQTVVATSDVPNQPAAAPTKPRATSSRRKARPQPKESDSATEGAGAGKVGAGDSSSKKAVTTGEDPAGNSPASEKSSSDSPVTPTGGGGERPRRVASPQPSPSVISGQPKNSKPKVIRWP